MCNISSSLVPSDTPINLPIIYPRTPSNKDLSSKIAGAITSVRSSSQIYSDTFIRIGGMRKGSSKDLSSKIADGITSPKDFPPVPSKNFIILPKRGRLQMGSSKDLPSQKTGAISLPRSSPSSSPRSHHFTHSKKEIKKVVIPSIEVPLFQSMKELEKNIEAFFFYGYNPYEQEARKKIGEILDTCITNYMDALTVFHHAEDNNIKEFYQNWQTMRTLDRWYNKLPTFISNAKMIPLDHEYVELLEEMHKNIKKMLFELNKELNEKIIKVNKNLREREDLMISIGIIS